MDKLKYNKPEAEVIYIDDVVVTSGSLSDGDPGGTAPDFDWDDSWPTYD